MPIFNSQEFLRLASQQAGIYQMFAADGKILYVGKAKNLKQRLASYFRSSGLAPKTQALVSRLASIETTITRSETEALLLEQNLIKALKPPFNILLRDDKSYPFIHFSEQDWPQVSLKRARHQRGAGQWFGPYPSVQSVNETLQLLYKIFRLRQCDNSTFSNRSRPCLQYQIGRCSAPCTGEITPEAYAQDIFNAQLLLEGKSEQVTGQLAEQMEAAAQVLDFELAGNYRDQIQALREVQTEQNVDTGQGEADVFALVSQGGQASLSLLQIRQGRLINTRQFNFTNPLEQADETTLAAFVAQYYLARTSLPPAKEILLSHQLAEPQVLAAALAEKFGFTSRLASKVRSQRASWLELAMTNAQQNLATRLSKASQQEERFSALAKALNLEQLERLEAFDTSHTQGEAAVAACVVFTQEGPRKEDYRRYNLTAIKAGDDYAALRQVLTRRYKRIQQGEISLPSLLVIDGGKGQLNVAIEVLAELELDLPILAIAEGVKGKYGLERLFLAGNEQEISLDTHSPALHLLQHLRDEAHRFALTGHRQRRAKARKTSSLDAIPGIGPQRKKALLHHFGGLQAISQASLEDLSQVAGISSALAKEIYTALH